MPGVAAVGMALSVGTTVALLAIEEAVPVEAGAPPPPQADAARASAIAIPMDARNGRIPFLPSPLGILE